jgi:hypothetical protein
MIRSFENRDALALHQIWMDHHSKLMARHANSGTAQPPLPLVGPDHLQQAILGRPFFDPARLLMAYDESGVPMGWAHSVPDPDGHRLITLVVSSRFESAIALQTARGLVDEISQRFGPLTLWGNAYDTSHGYAGLDPLGWGIGIAIEDETITRLAIEMGYRVDQRYERLILPLRNFRMPINRQFLQWRRTVETLSQWTLSGSSRTDAAMSHLDRNSILVTAGGRTLADLVIWTSDREAAVMPPSHALFDLNHFLQTAQSTTDEVFQFSLASAAASLSQQGMQTIEAVLNDHHKEWQAALQAIGFGIQAHGATYVR